MLNLEDSVKSSGKVLNLVKTGSNERLIISAKPANNNIFSSKPLPTAARFDQNLVKRVLTDPLK